MKNENIEYIGIYKITNNINAKCYIGQSCNIYRRWNAHINISKNKNDKAYNYPLYDDFRKYGLKNFTFEIIESFDTYNLELMLERESYWINFYKAEYNQTLGIDNNIIPNKLTEEQVDKIKQILLSNNVREILNKDIAKNFNVTEETIRDINIGKTWNDSKLSYPLRYYKPNDSKKKLGKNINYCKMCNSEISRDAIYCVECYKKIQEQNSKVNNISKEELKELIYKYSFTKIGEMYGVSDNTIRKWCKKYNLPYRKKDLVLTS